jgi:4-cresol dehydrogenase (hydroxylating)
MKTPPGMSERQFRQAIDRFIAVVGAGNVYTDEADVDLYRDPYSPVWGQAEERVASAAVAPASVEEVQAILRIANELRVPIYPVSTGRNLAYGAAAPAYSGSVVLDLKRMNRILDVDEINHSVLVEPGVSYFDLYRHFQENNVRMIIDTPDPGWGSPIGNSLDRGGGYTMAHFRNHFDAHCGMEVVLADGTLLRTGMGALPGARTWQQYKSGCGPWIDGIFSQSNFGVVTKMGFWLMPEPEAYLRGSVFVPRYRDLHRFVEILNYCENVKLFTGMPSLYSPLLGIVPMSQLAESMASPPMLTEQQAALVAAAKLGYSPELEAHALRAGIPYWGLDIPMYGPPEVIAAQWAAIKRRFAEIGGASFQDGEVIRFPVNPDDPRLHLPEFGITSLKMFSIITRSPASPVAFAGHMGFSPIIPRTGAAIIEANEVFQQVAREYGLPTLGSFTLPLLYWERAFIFIFSVMFTRDPAVDARTVAGVRALIRIAGEHGWGEYRTPPVFQDDVIAQYSFNDHALLRLNERLKDALDPNGILSAGRYGIWPKRLRKARFQR